MEWHAACRRAVAGAVPAQLSEEISNDCIHKISKRLPTRWPKTSPATCAACSPSKDLDVVPHIKALASARRQPSWRSPANWPPRRASSPPRRRAKPPDTANAYAHDEPWQIAGAALGGRCAGGPAAWSPLSACRAERVSGLSASASHRRRSMKLLSLFGLRRAPSPPAHRCRRRGDGGRGPRPAVAHGVGGRKAAAASGCSLLAIAVIGLTTVTVALLSVAIVVHFWDTPHRVTAAWSGRGRLDGALGRSRRSRWWRRLRKASAVPSSPTRRELERDWAWVQQRFGAWAATSETQAPPVSGPGDAGRAARAHRSASASASRCCETRRRPQRLRRQPPPPDESPSAAALRIAREHPVASGVAAAAVVAVLGPRRLLRWAAVVAPVLWRMR